jgi:hypothetical protein
MRCRTCKNQLIDFKGGRLSAEQAQRMTQHLQVCAVCAREAHSEARLEELWRSAKPSPARDLWPQIATRLEDQSVRARRAGGSARPPQWALVSAFCLAVAAVCGLSLGPKEFMTSSAPTTITAPAPSAQKTGSPVWKELSDVSRVNPIVDDPAGSSMDSVWVQINSSDDGKADAQ